MQWPNECSSPRFEIMFSYSCSIISTGALVASSILSKVFWYDFFSNNTIRESNQSKQREKVIISTIFQRYECPYIEDNVMGFFIWAENFD